VSRGEALGRPIFEILHRQPVATLRREFEEAFATGRIQRIEVDSYSLGELRTYRISKIPMRLDEGEVTHVITIGEDITEWKRTQERVARASKLAAVGQLAAGVMHEINNPLATIGVCAEGVAMRLEAVDLEPQARAAVDDYLQIVRSEVDRCKRIIERLLDFTRPRPLSKAPVNLNAVVEKTLALVKHHERFRKAAVECDLDGEHPIWVYGNEEALVQVFMALLLNAADAVQGRGRIAVRTRVQEEGETVVGEVADDGCGIARADLPKIFDPFFTTKEPGRGTGLGLSICYGLVADHAGRIEVESSVQTGSSFRVLLPRIRPPAG
jgi:two-component system NtrC family sensor kinase